MKKRAASVLQAASPISCARALENKSQLDAIAAKKYNHKLQARPVHLLALMSGALREHRVDLALEGRPRQGGNIHIFLLPEDLVHRRGYF